MREERFELFRAYTTECNLNRPYRFNERFRVISDPYGCWIDDDLIFPPLSVPGRSSEEYRTVFGPTFGSKSAMNSVSRDGIQGAVRRLTCVVSPETPGYHEELRANQFAMRQTLLADIEDWYLWYQRNMIVIVNGVELDDVEMRNMWTDAPHKKRRLRRRVRVEVNTHGNDRGTRTKVVNYGCKKGELLAWNKYLRGIGDLTTAGSTVGGYIMDIAKQVFEIGYRKGVGLAEFVKSPEPSILQGVFERLITPIGVYFAYFSDDSCVGVQCADGNFVANLDISCCDGSNYEPIFEILKQAMMVDPRFNHDIESTFQQLRLPMKVKNPNGRESVVFLPDGPVLYSGSVLTTSVNNMANTMIFISFMSMYNEGMTRAEMPALLTRAAHQVGFKVKIDVCECVEDIQFLKHSPSVIDGKVIPWLNIGTWLRGFGTYRGDLPGRGKDNKRKARIFNSDVVKSHVHSGNHCIHEAFKRHTVKETHGQNFEQLRPKVETGFTEYIPSESIAARYGVPVQYIEELARLIAGSEVGVAINHPVLDEIYKKDYGYQ